MNTDPYNETVHARRIESNPTTLPPSVVFAVMQEKVPHLYGKLVKLPPIGDTHAPTPIKTPERA